MSVLVYERVSLRLLACHPSAFLTNCCAIVLHSTPMRHKVLTPQSAKVDAGATDCYNWFRRRSMRRPILLFAALMAIALSRSVRKCVAWHRLLRWKAM